jgi:glycosyltransferase involved in cell wall biosynthesis
MSGTAAVAAGASAPVRVSVLMPMRNPGEFLRAAIASVLCQRDAGLELVVIDDGSTDGSRELVAAMADPRIVLVDGPRSGISACLNAGLARVSGEVLMRCDADDLYPPGRIRAQLDWLAAHPGFVGVCAPFDMIGPDGTDVAAPGRHLVDELTDAAERILDGRLRTHLCTFAFRREVLATTGAFRAFFETAEDIDFALRLAEAGPLGFLPVVAYRYRLHDASITHRQASARRLFFEATAYAMSRERLAGGRDALMRGTPPQAPPDTGPGGARDGADKHIAQLLVGEAWRAFQAGDRPLARRLAWRSLRARWRHLDAWKSVLLISIRPLPGSPGR